MKLARIVLTDQTRGGCLYSDFLPEHRRAIRHSIAERFRRRYAPGVGDRRRAIRHRGGGEDGRRMGGSVAKIQSPGGRVRDDAAR